LHPQNPDRKLTAVAEKPVPKPTEKNRHQQPCSSFGKHDRSRLTSVINTPASPLLGNIKLIVQKQFKLTQDYKCFFIVWKMLYF